jgi:hypothetical protein
MYRNRGLGQHAERELLASARLAAGVGALLAAIACGAQLLAPAPLAAQTAPASPAPATSSLIKKRNPTGSPLDTLLQTRLWADVPEAKEFVRKARPPEDALDYQPTTGTDPKRPKPRTPAEVDKLQKELESAGRRNEARAGELKSGKAPSAAAATPSKAPN